MPNFNKIRKLYLMYLIVRIANCVPIGEDNDDDEIDLSYYGEKIFGLPTSKSGEMLKEWKPSNNNNPEEFGEYLEGDILMPVNQSDKARNGMMAQSYRWPNAVIPYEFRGTFDTRSMNIIRNAMQTYHKKTCIRFRPRNNADKDYISIQNSESGCWSSVGRIGGGQTVNLQQPACTTLLGTVLHEFMHSAGFLHEQNREERDQYIDIVSGNIRRGYESNFYKASKGSTSGFGVGYDYNSVMHYSANAFSANGQPTIVTKVQIEFR